MSKRFNRDDVDKFIDNDIYLPTRTLYVGTMTASEGESQGVDWAMAERTVKNLHMLESLAPNGDQPINIILNTEGGTWEDGMAIFDAIRKCKNHVTITVSGRAYSMGSIILQAADDRLMDENSTFMMHIGSWGVPHDHAKTNYKWSDFYKSWDKKMEQIFLDRIHQINETVTRKQVQKMLEFDTIMSSRGALEACLVDGIITGDKIIRSKDLEKSEEA